MDLDYLGNIVQIPQIGNRYKSTCVFLKDSVTDAHLFSETHLSPIHFKTKGHLHNKDHHGNL